MIKMSVSIRTPLLNPEVKYYNIYFWWRRNSVAFAILPMAVVDGKQ